MQDSSFPVNLHQNVYLSFLSILEDGVCKQTPSCAIFQNIAAGQTQNLFPMTNNSRHFVASESQTIYALEDGSASRRRARDSLGKLLMKRASFEVGNHGVNGA